MEKRDARASASITYNTFDYFGVAAHELVSAAHQALVRQHRLAELEAISWYWKPRAASNGAAQHHQELVGPFTVHSGPAASLPVALVCLYLDSQIKTYMDRDALGDAVRRTIRNNDERAAVATIVARERELARRIGGGSLEAKNLLMTVVEFDGYAVGGMIVNPGKSNSTVATIMAPGSSAATSIAAFQADFTLPHEHPLLAKRENEIVDLVRYFRAPDHLLKRIFPTSLLERNAYRGAVHLIRALTICEAFAMTERWMRESRAVITTCVCETPNEDVKALIEGKRLKRSDGTELKVGGIPHQTLTSSPGAELYPAAYQDRAEGYSKIYTLYSFDFAEIAARAKEYRRLAVAAYEEGNSRQASQA